MRNKIKLLAVILICTQVIFCIKSIANEPQTITKEQQAIQDVAYAFYYRGENLQYDDYSMTDNTAKFKDNPNTTIKSKRRSQYTHYPEEATPQDIQYTVCAEYVANVFYEAFSDGNGNPYLMKSKAGKIAWTSSAIVLLADNTNSWFNDNLAVFYADSNKAIHYVDKEDSEEKEAVDLRDENHTKLEDFRDFLKDVNDGGILEPGDVIAYKVTGPNGEWGHVLLYLGDDIIINASSISNGLKGGSYSYYYKRDLIDEKGTVGILSLNDDVLSNTVEINKEKYILEDNVSRLAILRPLNEIKSNPTQESDYRISDKTLERMKHNKLVRTKTASINKYENANIGDEITYYITIENKSDTEDYENIVITDEIPENTELVNLSEDGENENGNLTWNMNLKKGEKKIVSYTVKINNDQWLLGKTITSDSCIVDGVKLNKIETFINNKLVDENVFRESANELVGKNYESTNLMLNAMYPQYEFPSVDEILAIFYDTKTVTTQGKASRTLLKRRRKTSFYFKE